MAKIKKLPAQSVIDGFRGKLDFYAYMGLACVRSWPRSPGHDRAPKVEEQWPAFTFASSYWTNLSTEIQQSFITMASGYPVTGRDLFVKAVISGDLVKIVGA